MSEQKEPLCKVGDVVRIGSEPWNMFSGQTVVITRCELLGHTWVYDFMIPERRGSVPEHMLEHKIINVDLKTVTS